MSSQLVPFPSVPFCSEPCLSLPPYKVSLFSQGALQGVVVVLEALELQEVLGPLAALAGGGQVGDLDGGGGGAACGGTSQVLGGALVLQVQAGAAGVGLHPGVWKSERVRSIMSTEMGWLPVPGNHLITGTHSQT